MKYWILVILIIQDCPTGLLKIYGEVIWPKMIIMEIHWLIPVAIYQSLKIRSNLQIPIFPAARKTNVLNLIINRINLIN